MLSTDTTVSSCLEHLPEARRGGNLGRQRRRRRRTLSTFSGRECGGGGMVGSVLVSQRLPSSRLNVFFDARSNGRRIGEDEKQAVR